MARVLKWNCLFPNWQIQAGKISVVGLNTKEDFPFDRLSRTQSFSLNAVGLQRRML